MIQIIYFKINVKLIFVPLIYFKTSFTVKFMTTEETIMTDGA